MSETSPEAVIPPDVTVHGQTYYDKNVEITGDYVAGPGDGLGEGDVLGGGDYVAGQTTYSGAVVGEGDSAPHRFGQEGDATADPRSQDSTLPPPAYRMPKRSQADLGQTPGGLDIVAAPEVSDQAGGQSTIGESKTGRAQQLSGRMAVFAAAQANQGGSPK